MAVEIAVEFGTNAQSLDALRAAAYRLIGTAVCRIEKEDDRYVCQLTSREASKSGKALDHEGLRLRFLELVTDENLRERLAVKTEPVRNLILALAFGSLASQQNEKL